MYRSAMESLVAWKSSKKRKPLILNGARQVGKTWLACEFGKQHFSEVAHVVFFNNQPMKAIFDGSLNPKRLLQAISVETNTHAQSGECLVVLDEIQECPRALESLKLFCEQAPEIPIIAAGSLLGISLHQNVSFPVGKVDILNLHPMTFFEYLKANNESLASLLDEGDFDVICAFEEKFIDEYKTYLVVGGMPEVVKSFAGGCTLDEARTIQEAILTGYENDFSKHTSGLVAKKIAYVFQSIPSQLAKENKKFLFSVVKKGARARGFEECIQWLLDAGLIYKVNRVSAAHMPLKSYEDLQAFKIYLHDVGLLGALANLNPKALLDNNPLLKEFKGSITEQYVCQQLVSQYDIAPNYWSAANSSGEVDFVVEFNNSIIPIEVKASINLKSKSLKVFQEKYDLPLRVRISLAPFERNGNILNMPLYALHCFKQALKLVVS